MVPESHDVDWPSGGQCRLDEESFIHFAPLLRACQDYAALSGFRFGLRTYEELHEHAEADDASEVTILSGATRHSGGSVSLYADAELLRTSDPQMRELGSSEQRHSALSLTRAKLAATPEVHEFVARLQAGDPTLISEVHQAFQLDMKESVRHSMISTCRALGVFPPLPPPADIDESDCSFDETSASLPHIAQRLYNDYLRRINESRPCGGRLTAASMTAAFIVDFAKAVGVAMPGTDEAQRVYQEFTWRAEAWSDHRRSFRCRRNELLKCKTVVIADQPELDSTACGLSCSIDPLREAGAIYQAAVRSVASKIMDTLPGVAGWWCNSTHVAAK